MSEGRRPVFIRHRVNRIAEIEHGDPRWGLECDLRCGPRPGTIRLAHDPYEAGDDFAVWLDRAVEVGVTGPIILNTKDDGLEAVARDLMLARGLEDWFFLDTQVPTRVGWTFHRGEDRFAVRLSRFEPAEALEPFRGRCRWVWVDCFGGEPLPVEQVRRAAVGFRVCLVSPELQGAGVEAVGRFTRLLPLADAICTRAPEAWMVVLGR